MLKKIALVMLLALPMGVFAQNLKFGHINAQEIITVMPEFTKAQNDIQNSQNDAMAPIYKKLDDAIKAVGAAEGVIYIFDLARTPIPYVNETLSINLTNKVKANLGIK